MRIAASLVWNGLAAMLAVLAAGANLVTDLRRVTAQHPGSSLAGVAPSRDQPADRTLRVLELKPSKDS